MGKLTQVFRRPPAETLQHNGGVFPLGRKVHQQKRKGEGIPDCKFVQQRFRGDDRQPHQRPGQRSREVEEKRRWQDNRPPVQGKVADIRRWERKHLAHWQ